MKIVDGAHGWWHTKITIIAPQLWYQSAKNDGNWGKEGQIKDGMWQEWTVRDTLVVVSEVDLHIKIINLNTITILILEIF